MQENVNEENLKPIVFIEGEKMKYRQNTHMQTLLIKALSEGVTDVKELKQIVGANTAAEVYQTLDKLALRREYHKALAEGGVTMDKIIGNMKRIAFESDSDATQLKAMQTILRSVGLEKYEKEEDAGKNWEETIVKLSEEKKLEDAQQAYEVDQPTIPESVKARREEEKKLSQDLYGKT